MDEWNFLKSCNCMSAMIENLNNGIMTSEKQHGGRWWGFKYLNSRKQYDLRSIFSVVFRDWNYKTAKREKQNWWTCGWMNEERVIVSNLTRSSLSRSGFLAGCGCPAISSERSQWFLASPFSVNGNLTFSGTVQRTWNEWMKNKKQKKEQKLPKSNVEEVVAATSTLVVVSKR